MLHTSKKEIFDFVFRPATNKQICPSELFLTTKKKNQIFLFIPHSEIYCWTKWPALILSYLSMNREPEVLM